MGSGEGVKLQLFQALTRNARPDSNSRPTIQILNSLLSHYALEFKLHASSLDGILNLRIWTIGSWASRLTINYANNYICILLKLNAFMCVLILVCSQKYFS
jgi:hypothetical protein